MHQPDITQNGLSISHRNNIFETRKKSLPPIPLVQLQTSQNKAIDYEITNNNNREYKNGNNYNND